MNRPRLVTDGSWSLSIFPATRFASCVKFRRAVASTAPNTTPPTRNVMASPSRYWNSPSSVVMPDSVGVWYFRPAIGPAKTPVRTGLRTGAEDFSIEVSFSVRVRRLDALAPLSGTSTTVRAALRSARSEHDRIGAAGQSLVEALCNFLGQLLQHLLLLRMHDVKARH